MANKPFDYTIINPLERPKSADLNQMQGQAHSDVRMLARQLFKSPSSLYLPPAEGFVSDSFYVTRYTGVFGFQFRPGIGFQNGTTNTSIGGISGLNDSFAYKPVVMSDFRQVTFPGDHECAAGYKRIDLVQVRCLPSTDGSTTSAQLADSQSTDILAPTTQSFNSTDKFKTLTFDLLGADIQYAAPGDTLNSPIVVKKGVAVPVWSSAIPPTPDAGYLAVAQISIGDTTDPLTSSDIDDQRNVLSVSGIDYSDTVKGTGILPVSRGGTGLDTLTDGALLVGRGTNDVDFIPVPSALYIPISNGTSWVTTSLPDLLVNSQEYYQKIITTENQYDVPWSTSSLTVAAGPWIELLALRYTGITLRAGLTRISIRPSASYPNALFNASSAPISLGESATIAIRMTVTAPSSATTTYYFRSRFSRNEDSQNLRLDLNAEINLSDAGAYSFKFEAQSCGDEDNNVQVRVNYMTLVVAQG